MARLNCFRLIGAKFSFLISVLHTAASTESLCVAFKCSLCIIRFGMLGAIFSVSPFHCSPKFAKYFTCFIDKQLSINCVYNFYTCGANVLIYLRDNVAEIT